LNKLYNSSNMWNVTLHIYMLRMRNQCIYDAIIRWLSLKQSNCICAWTVRHMPLFLFPFGLQKCALSQNYSYYSCYLQENAEKYIKSCYYSQKYSLNFFIFISQISLMVTVIMILYRTMVSNNYFLWWPDTHINQKKNKKNWKQKDNVM